MYEVIPRSSADFKLTETTGQRRTIGIYLNSSIVRSLRAVSTESTMMTSYACPAALVG